MYIKKLEISNVRNLTDIDIEAEPGINFFFGENGAGKTAILESIHLLSLAKSFKNQRLSNLLQFNKDTLTVTTDIVEKNRKIVAGLNKKRGETHLKYNGEKVARASQQARNVPLFLVIPESHRILSGSPKERRHWLDWAMFHVEPGYMEVWKQYYRGLRHRNALLRKKSKEREFLVWEEVMVKNAIIISEHRRKYIKALQVAVNNIEDKTFNEIVIKEKKNEGLDIGKYLSEERLSDMGLGYTRQGPHTDDVMFYINGGEARESLSRGQAKLFIIYLITSQVIEFIEKNNKKPILLVDDMSAELDTKNLKKAFARLVSLELQMFINSVYRSTVESLNKEATMFHVERGKVTKMLE